MKLTITAITASTKEYTLPEMGLGRDFLAARTEIAGVGLRVDTIHAKKMRKIHDDEPLFSFKCSEATFSFRGLEY